MNLARLEAYLMRHMPAAAIAEAISAALRDVEEVLVKDGPHNFVLVHKTMWEQLRKEHEALAPRDASPGLAEVEGRFRLLAADGGRESRIMCAELDRLRAALAEAEQRGWRQALGEATRQVRSMERLASNSLSMDNGHHHRSTAYATAATWLEAQLAACTPSDGGRNDGKG